MVGGEPREGARGRTEKRKTVEGRVRGLDIMLRTLGFTLSKMRSHRRILSIGTT